MTHLAMCRNTACEKRGSCLRYLAHPAPAQSYSVFQAEGCVSHVAVLQDEQVRTLDEVDSEDKKSVH